MGTRTYPEAAPKLVMPVDLHAYMQIRPLFSRPRACHVDSTLLHTSLFSTSQDPVQGTEAGFRTDAVPNGKVDLNIAACTRFVVIQDQVPIPSADPSPQDVNGGPIGLGDDHLASRRLVACYLRREKHSRFANWQS